MLPSSAVAGARVAVAAALAVSAVVAACAAPGTPTGSPVGPSSAPSAPAPASPSDPSTEPSVAAPPPARLVLPDGTRLAGEPGSWAIDGAGGEVPWLPASALEAARVAPDTTLAVELGDGLAVGAWRADVAAATDTTGADAGPLAGRDTATPPLERVELPPLAAGSWVVRVTLWLADGRGDAAYSWAIEVPGG